ncbi:dTMP kinase [Candidatus Saccharibacteria bacterium]|nr:dTMP kinase [Candidatus Saccharibacteria bacterium]
MYIVIEGQDATGKSTQVEMLADYLREQGKEVITMHEPDGDLESTHVLRDLIKNKKYDLEPMTHVLLFTAARQELWRKLAEPVLKRGGYVISARNWWSTLAYQGYGQGVSRSRIIRVTKETMPDQYVNPDKAVIFTLDEQERLARQSGRDDNSKKDTFESKPRSFQEKVDAAYINIAKDFIIPTIDASQDAERIQLALRKLFGV